jgi:hypothetical protein
MFTYLLCIYLFNLKWMPRQPGMARPQYTKGSAGQKLMLYCISSHGQPIMGGLVAGDLGGGLKIPHLCTRTLRHIAQDLVLHGLL